MDSLFLAASLVQWVVGVVIGIRLLRLGLRTRRCLELTIGFSWLTAVLASIFWLLSAVVPEASGQGFIARLSTLAFSSISCGLILVATWWIFRRRSPWATAFTVFALLGLALGTMGMFLFVYGWLRAVPYIWLGTESFLEQSRLRKQLRFGLEPDRTLADQMFFLGMLNVSGAASYVFIMVQAVFLPSLPAREISAVLTFVSAFFSWLAFLPPKTYLRWARKGRGDG